jgi:hypothetical protein
MAALCESARFQDPHPNDPNLNDERNHSHKDEPEFATHEGGDEP